MDALTKSLHLPTSGYFIDQPVRTYSSGMYLRLAFAVAVNVDPEILLVDEALAVGDAGFRSRCFRRIRELRNVGCTILFVSHDVEQIVRLCDQAMLIDEGELLFSGSPEAVVGRYHRLMGAEPGARPEIRKMYKAEKGGATNTTVSADEPGIDKAVEYYDHDLCPESSVAYEPNGALIEAVRIVALSGERVNQLLSGRTYRCAYRVCFTNTAVDVRFAMLIKTSAGMDLGGAMSAPASVGDGASVSQGSIANVEFEFNCMLNPGVYHLSVAVFGSVAGLEYALHGITGAEVFRVVAEAGHLAMANVDFGCRAAVQFVDTEAQ